MYSSIILVAPYVFLPLYILFFSCVQNRQNIDHRVVRDQVYIGLPQSLLTCMATITFASTVLTIGLSSNLHTQRWIKTPTLGHHNISMFPCIHVITQASNVLPYARLQTNIHKLMTSLCYLVRYHCR
jgi:hypothetical protein